MIPVERRLLIKVANMYYIENMKQSDIAAKLGINRTTVSKYLKRAMDAGLVKISIVDDSYAYLEAALERKFNLKEVYIVSSNSDSDEVKNNMGKAGLAFLKRIIAVNKTVGFAWGSAIGALARQSALEHCSPVAVDFVPLVGGPENIDSEFHVNTICYKVAQAFAANSHYLYAPAITKTPEIREAISFDRCNASEKVSRFVGANILITLSGYIRFFLPIFTISISRLLFSRAAGDRKSVV